MFPHPSKTSSSIVSSCLYRYTYTHHHQNATSNMISYPSSPDQISIHAGPYHPTSNLNSARSAHEQSLPLEPVHCPRITHPPPRARHLILRQPDAPARTGAGRGGRRRGGRRGRRVGRVVVSVRVWRRVRRVEGVLVRGLLVGVSLRRAGWLEVGSFFRVSSIVGLGWVSG